MECPQCLNVVTSKVKIHKKQNVWKTIGYSFLGLLCCALWIVGPGCIVKSSWYSCDSCREMKGISHICPACKGTIVKIDAEEFEEHGQKLIRFKIVNPYKNKETKSE